MTIQSTVERLAQHAARYVRDPLKNLLLDVEGPALGLLNDIPPEKFRDDEARCWAVAGFSFVINDAEHSQSYYGRQQNAALLRLGITPIQRLPRDAGSLFGDALTLGARGVMRPYATTLGEVSDFVAYCTYPPNGVRGAYPPRDGAGKLSADLMARDEANASPWLQFETPELLEDDVRCLALDALAWRKGVAFIGALDLAVRGGSDNLPALYADAARREVPVGGIFPSVHDDRDAAATLRRQFDAGLKFVVAPVFASDLPLRGAASVARPFFDALGR